MERMITVGEHPEIKNLRPKMSRKYLTLSKKKKALPTLKSEQPKRLYKTVEAQYQGVTIIL